MKNFVLYCLSVWALSFGAFAQSSITGRIADVEKSDKIVFPKKHYQFGVVGLPKATLISATNKEFGFHTLDENLNIENTVLSPKNKSKYALYEDIIIWHNHPYMVMSDYNSKTSEESLKFVGIDNDQGKAVLDEINIVKNNGKLKGVLHASGMYSYTAHDKFDIYHTNDSKYLGVVMQPLAGIKGDLSQDILTVFNENFEQVAQASFKSKGKKLGFAIDGDNYYYMKLEKAEPDKKNSSTPSKAYVHIHRLNLKNKKAKSTVIDLEKMSAYSVKFVESKDGQLAAVGYYFDKKTRGLSGYFSTTLDLEALKFGKLNLYPFPKELLLQNESDRLAKKVEKGEKKGKELGVKELIVRKLLKRSDGGYYMVGEQAYKYYTLKVYGSGKVRLELHYIFADEYISSLDSNLNELWVRKIPKNQDWVDSDHLGGISIHMHNDNLYIFRLDHFENQNLVDEAPRSLISFATASLSLSRITPDGSVQTEFLTNYKEDGEFVNPNNIKEIEPGKIISYGTTYSLSKKKKKNTVYKINLK